MSDNNSSGGIGISWAIFIVFLTLKLTHVINWSWWWVTCPLWLVFALAGGVAGIFVCFAAFASFIEFCMKRERGQK